MGDRAGCVANLAMEASSQEGREALCSGLVPRSGSWCPSSPASRPSPAPDTFLLGSGLQGRSASFRDGQKRSSMEAAPLLASQRRRHMLGLDPRNSARRPPTQQRRLLREPASHFRSRLSRSSSDWKPFNPVLTRPQRPLEFGRVYSSWTRRKKRTMARTAFRWSCFHQISNAHMGRKTGN